MIPNGTSTMLTAQSNLAQFEMIDYYSVLLFYVPESSLIRQKITLSKFRMCFYNILGIDKPVIKPQKRKIDEISEEEFVITPEETERWKSIYKPDLSRYPENIVVPTTKL